MAFQNISNVATAVTIILHQYSEVILSAAAVLKTIFFIVHQNVEFLPWKELLWNGNKKILSIKKCSDWVSESSRKSGKRKIIVLNWGWQNTPFNY